MSGAIETGECIFEGAKSRVYRGRDAEDHAVVVKQLRDLYPGPDVVRRFQREFEITRQAAGEGIIEVHATHTHDGMLSMVVEDYGATPWATQEHPCTNAGRELVAESPGSCWRLEGEPEPSVFRWMYVPTAR